MNTYNFDVNYTKGVVYGPNILLVSNDHNSTIFKFNFDQTGRHVFKLLYPDGTCYVQDIIDNQLILTKGVLNQEGNYQFEVSLYRDDSRLTTARIKEFPVRLELVDTDSVVQPDDRVPILDNLIEETNKVVEAAKKGEFDGATFTPNVSENGDLSWTNDKGKENPPTVNIKGEPGEPGEPGAVKMQVVDTLPEVGETDTIYLLKKDTPDEDNYYDEYIYTTNNGWEHIGDTSVDLTDYYTKEETTAIIPPVLCLHEKNDSFGISRNMLLSDNLKQQFSDFVNKHPNQPFITYVFDQYHLSYCMTICYFDLTGGPRTSNEQRFTQYMSTVGDKNDLLGQGRIFYSYNLDSNNVITFTKIALTLLDNQYATKTYVDDNKYTLPIASASTLGGIKVGENLTIDENGVLSTSGGANNNIPSFFIDIPSQPLNENNTGTKYTLPTSFNEKLTTNLNNILDIYQTFSIQFLINDILVTFNPSYSIDTYGYGTRRFNSTSKPTSINLFANIVNNKYDISASADPVMYGGFLPITLELKLTWDNTTPSVTKGVYKLYGYSSPIPSIRYIQKNLLTKTNTTGYTPTNDYNPATKKYVDDAVASAGGGEPEMYVLEFSGDYNPSYQYSATDNDKIRVAELITTLKEDASVPIYAKFKNGYGLLFTPNYDIQPGQQPYYLYQCIRYNNTNIRTLWLCGLNIYGTWENNIFTVNTCFVSTDTNGFLSTGTQSSINNGFNPTLDQHPATKKYVDDTITAAITTSLEGSY